MEELYREGKVRAIGVSNFYDEHLIDFIIHHEVTPAVNQVGTHPFDQQIESQKLMEEHDVQIQAWTPLAKGENNVFRNETLVSIAKI